MIAFLKFFAIYFVNIKMLLHFDINFLLLIISAFYILLFTFTSDTVINRLFNIQQVFILISKVFDNLNTSFNNIHDLHNNKKK